MVIIRGPIGRFGMDENFKKNYINAGLAGHDRGMYGVWLPGREPKEQADHFSTTYTSAKDGWEFSPACDFEIVPEPARNVADEVREYLLLIEEQLGFKPFIYTAAYWWNQWVGDTDWAKEYGLWVAGYPNPQHTMHYPEEYWHGYTPLGWDDDAWTIWQFTTIGPGSHWGVQSSYLDLNWVKIS